MMMDRQFHRLILFLVALPAAHAQAQLALDHTLTPEQMVQQYLVGEGVQVMNVQLIAEGDTALGEHQAASFIASNMPTLVEEGIVLTTGRIDRVADPASFFSNFDPGIGGNLGWDGDISSITGQYTDNAVALEFDLIPEGDTLRIMALLASEEHPEYVCSQYNDAMGVFIHGPGIVGPYANGAVNMALMPGTDSIFSVNAVRVPDTAIVVPGICEAVNTPLYIDNREDPYMVFDGLTTWFTFKHAVQPGQVHHLKIVVADVNDGVWDSGVFLAKGGLISSVGNTALRPSTAIRPSAWWDDTGILYIQQADGETRTLELIDMSGRLILSWNTSASTILPCTWLSAGTYFLRSRTEGGYPVLRTVKP